MMDHTQLPVKSFTQPNGIEEYHVSGIEGWDDFEFLVEFIVRRFSAEVIDKLDGICSRTWILRVGEFDFTVKHHDDIGNFFFVGESSVAKQELMKAIADALNTKLLQV
jgi:hypothetical protein